MTRAIAVPADAPPCHVLVIGMDEAANRQVAETLGQAGGFVASMPEPASLAATAFGALGGRTALVIVGTAIDQLTRQLCEEAIGANLPVLAIADASGLPPGVCAAGADASPEFVLGVLRGLLARQAAMDELAALLQRAIANDAPLRSEMNRLQDELVLAASVQREFLPRTLPNFGEWSSAALWRPASYVSGDIYNAFRADEHHLALFLLDAVGHGVPAALLTLVLARALPVKRIEPGSYRLHSPAEALSLLNAEMVSHTGRNARFATAAYGLLDLRTGRLRVATAGHPAPFIARPGKPLEPVRSSGPILGILEDAEFQEDEVELAPGDSLLLYTDGFENLYPKVHPTIPGAMLPTDRYVALLEESATHGRAGAIVRHVEEAIDRATGGLPLIDDVTMLAISRAAGA